MTADFEDAAFAIVDRLERHRSPVGKGSAFAAMVSQFRERGCCEVAIADVFEAEITAFLRSLKVADLRQLWATSESGMSYPDDADEMSKAALVMVLEPELLARVTEMASDKARIGQRRPRRP